MFAFLGLAVAPVAHGATLSGSFTGTVLTGRQYMANGAGIYLISGHPTLTNGAVVSGSFSFTTDGAVDTNASSQIGAYLVSGTLTMTAAGLTYNSGGALVVNVTDAPGGDAFQVQEPVNLANGRTAEIEILLPPGTFSSDALPGSFSSAAAGTATSLVNFGQTPQPPNLPPGTLSGPDYTYRAASLSVTSSVIPPAPKLIHYQGRLQQGTNLVSGTVGLSLRVMNGPSGGPVLYEDSNTVTVVDGLYATYLGDHTTTGDLVQALSVTNAYLEVAVNGSPLSPRERFGASAYSLIALDAYALAGQPVSTFATGTPVYVESDPVWTAQKAGYATGTPLYVFTEADPKWSGASNLYYLKTQADGLFATGTPLYVFTEADPKWSGASNLYYLKTQADGLFATGTPLYVFTEADPKWSGASNLYYLKTQADGLFATGTPLYVFTEADPKWSGASNLYYLRTQADALFATGTPLYVFAEADPLWAAASNGVQVQFGAELTARANADAALSNAVAGELAARVAADGSLSNSVVALGMDVASRADSNLVWATFAPAADLALETSSRIATAAALSNAVNAEAAARAAADASFSNGLAGTWSITGNAATVAGAHFLGTTDAQPLDVRVQNQRALRLQPGGGAPGAVLGSAQNVLATNTAGAAVLGGSNNQVGAASDYGVIVGGQLNAIGSNAPNALAAGRRARALHAGAFVWADAQNADFASTASNQFIVRASGGVGINTNATTPGGLTVGGPVVAASFTGSGSGLTGLSATSLVPALATNLALLAGGTQTFTAPVVFSNPSSSFAGNGGSLTNLAAEALTGNSLAWGGLVLVSTSSVGAQPQSVVAADFNGDGRPDLASSAFSGNSVTILTNAGAGRFSLRQTVAVGSSPRGMAAADVNGDGRIDLISGNQFGGTLSVLTNSGNGLFTVSSTPTVGGQPSGVAAADFNGDGAPDLATVDFGGSSLLVLTNSGSGAFGVHRSYTMANNPFHVVSVDVNADGHQDFAVANFGSDTISVWTNNGTGVFTNRSSKLVGASPIGLSAADFNADGSVDLAVANFDSANVTILTNNGTGLYGTRATVSVGTQPGGVATTDIDGDGDIDVLCACLGSDELYVLQNDGTGRFSLYACPSGNGSRFVVAADFDGDGRSDAATANQDANTATIFLNRLLFTGRLAGDGYALTGITGASIVPDTLTGAHIVNGTISNADLAADSVTGANIADGAIGTNHLQSSLGVWQTSFGDLVTSGRSVGVGTLLPETEVHIQRGSAGAVVVNASALLALEGSANTMIQFLAPTNAMTGILFGDPASPLRTSIRVNNNGDNEMTFRVGDNNTKMIIQSNGFVGIGTTAPTNRLHVVGTVQATAYITTSDRNAKTDIAPVEPQQILEKVAALPIATWRFKDEQNGVHLGPMAQDFHAAFGLGNTDTGIFTIDANGVALAAIQALAADGRVQRAGFTVQQEQIKSLEAENASLKQQLEALTRRQQELESRLRTVLPAR